MTGGMTGPAATAARPRVVCVDDDASIRRFVGLVLEDLPVDFIACADAAAAREALRQGPVALLITDLMMPGENGFELLASLAADPALRGGARLAVFSAGLNAGTRARLEGLDVWRELDKPVSVTALEACVNEALQRAPAAARPAAPAAPEAIDAITRAVIDDAFGGDAALYTAFRTSALAQFVADREALAQALGAGDWPALHRQAHSLKGALATLGDRAGCDHARRLEDAAAQADEAACRQHWPALDRHLEDLQRRN